MNPETQFYQELEGKRLAVDVSFWYCAVLANQAANATLPKPHIVQVLRRCVNYMSTKFAPVQLLMVTDPACPDDGGYKNGERLRRHQARTGAHSNPMYSVSSGDSTRGGIPHGYAFRRNADFVREMGELTEMFRLLGLPCVEARGDAEQASTPAREDNTLALEPKSEIETRAFCVRPRAACADIASHHEALGRGSHTDITPGASATHRH
jgi:hypothetical protein